LALLGMLRAGHQKQGPSPGGDPPCTATARSRKAESKASGPSGSSRDAGYRMVKSNR
jgi:hypothetical protein